MWFLYNRIIVRAILLANLKKRSKFESTPQLLKHILVQVNSLKYSLLDKLISIRDISLLEKINDLIGNVDVNKPVFKVTDGQSQMLMKSEEDIRNGNLTTDEELNAEEDQWLNG